MMIHSEEHVVIKCVNVFSTCGSGRARFALFFFVACPALATSAVDCLKASQSSAAGLADLQHLLHQNPLSVFSRMFTAPAHHEKLLPELQELLPPRWPVLPYPIRMQQPLANSTNKSRQTGGHKRVKRQVRRELVQR